MDREKLQKLLERARERKADGSSEPAVKPGALDYLPWNRRVDMSKDLERILRIPRREWLPEEMEELAEIMTPLLAKPGGTQKLRPVQAVSLHDLASEKGLISTARVGAGKAQPDFEPILTPHGWRKMGDIRVGDEVFGRDGEPHKVLGVFPQGERDVYKISFSDGTWALSDIEHLWTFQVALRKWETKTLREWMQVPLFREAETKKGTYRISRLNLPMTEPVNFEKRQLPIDPYTLGALLGDGGMSQRAISFTSMDQEIVDRLKLPDGVMLIKTKHQNAGEATTYNITKGRKGNFENPLLTILVELGLFGKLSKDKHIPRQYLIGSIEQRLDLLRGICDTDGSCGRAAKVDITLASLQLRNDVAELVESLGGTAKRYGKKITYRGEDREYYRLNFTLPERFVPFHLGRKKELYKSALKTRQRRNPKRFVKEIEHYGSFPCTCISVDAEDSLYLTRFCVVTHNTLITLLGAYVTESVRPLIVVPANLKKKTKRDIKFYREHWEIAEFVRVESYEWLSRKKQLYFWEEYRPDLVMFDEAHKLRDTSTATVRRLRRYLTEIRPQTILGLLSGTLTNRSLKDFWHLLRWTLPYENCPLPHNYNELDLWSLAVDEKVSEMNRVQPGALIELCDEAERDMFREDPIKSVRLGIQRRIRQTPGVVTTRETFEGASLQIKAWNFDPPKHVRETIDKLRVDWETPGSEKRADGTQEIPGHPISDATELSQHEKEMALGFYYIWDPPPPDEWLRARKAFCKSVRAILRYNNRKLDTEAQVVEALDNGFYSMHKEHLDAWRKVKDLYDPEKHKKTVWISDFALKKAAEWMKENNGIVWVFHTAFGKKLSEMTGVTYYAGEGLDAKGNFIEDHPADQPLIASMHANREGKNLQKWNKNLMTFPHTNGGWWEQLLGRTHRDGQEEDTVYVDMFYVTLAHLESFYRAKGDAKYIEEISGQVQKMLYADLLVPTFDEVEYGELLKEAEERGYETGSDHHTDGHGDVWIGPEGARDHSDRRDQAHPS